MWNQDATQAYIQGQRLQRDVYEENSKELKPKEEMYLKLLKHAYGPSESGDSWFHTYKDVVKKELDQSTIGIRKPRKKHSTNGKQQALMTFKQQDTN